MPGGLGALTGDCVPIPCSPSTVSCLGGLNQSSGRLTTPVGYSTFQHGQYTIDTGEGQERRGMYHCDAIVRESHLVWVWGNIYSPASRQGGVGRVSRHIARVLASHGDYHGSHHDTTAVVKLSFYYRRNQLHFIQILPKQYIQLLTYGCCTPRHGLG